MQLTLLLCSLAFLICLQTAEAQPGSYYNQRDDQYRLLGLKRARELYETARADYERQQDLFKKGMISQQELDRAHNVFADAEVNYQQSLLAVLFEKQYVSVAGAVKYQANDGGKHVRLKVINTSGGTAEYRKLLNIDDELFRTLQPDVIPNIYLSLMNDDGAVISQPYEAKIDELRYGEPVVIDFALLQDLDYVTVSMVYANGATRNMKIYLQKDNSVNKVVVQSEQFSQEVELGEAARFDLNLELFSGVNNTFSLEVLNLPRQIGRYFQDPAGQARLSQVKFTESTNSKKAVLQVTLPDRPTDEVAMDKPIQFFVVVAARDKLPELRRDPDKIWTEDELKKLDAGYVRLELLPRGRGELRVRAPQLYQAIGSDDKAAMYVDILNEGTHRIDNIEIKADLPLGWTKSIRPDIISSMEIGDETRVELEFTPPPDVAAGKYEIRLRTSGQSNNQPVTAEDKSVTVEVKSGTNLLGTASIVLILIGVIGGVVVYGIRLSRK